MSARKTVMVAMSGGVDSSAAAAFLVEEGYRVLGVTFLLAEVSPPQGRDASGEYHYMERARQAAESLGIEHRVLDLREDFLSAVVMPFTAEYLRGRTPNPCVECNHRVKFPALMRAAADAGADYLATGHYARVEKGNDGTCSLLRGRDAGKDQSYVLYRLGQEVLGRCLFPNGERTKEEVVAAARERGLPVDSMRESQDICFLAGTDYRDFLLSRCPQCRAPGPLLDTEGRVLGQHEGMAFYTVGQRRGLGLSFPHPMYVVRLDPECNAVVLGGKEEVPGTWLRAEDASWIRGEPPAASFRAEAVARYNAVAVPCRVEVEEGGFTLSFDSPVWALTPGQHAVIYQGEEVLGGGIIASVR